MQLEERSDKTFRCFSCLHLAAMTGCRHQKQTNAAFLRDKKDCNRRALHEKQPITLDSSHDVSQVFHAAAVTRRISGQLCALH